MARKAAETKLPLLAHLPRFEVDGSTHQRDCECVRCDAGFRPTEQQRESARLRWEVERARAAAERALARRREREQVKKAAVALELGAAANDVDQRIRAHAPRVTGGWPCSNGYVGPGCLSRRRSPPSIARKTKTGWAQQGSNLRPTD
jgi:hypothetical protein